MVEGVGPTFAKNAKATSRNVQMKELALSGSQDLFDSLRFFGQEEPFVTAAGRNARATRDVKERPGGPGGGLILVTRFLLPV
jgi:hypothetical protein